jgi:hypothetical protein
MKITAHDRLARVHKGFQPADAYGRIARLIRRFWRSGPSLCTPHAPPPYAARAQRPGSSRNRLHPTLDSALVEPSRGYFPRAVFFFGFGFLVLPVLPGA